MAPSNQGAYKLMCVLLLCVQLRNVIKEEPDWERRNRACVF